MKNKERKFVLNESQIMDVVNYAYRKFGYRPAKKIDESIFDDFKFLNEDEDTEAANDPTEEKVDKVTDEQLRVDSLKTAVKLARLMNKVTPEDMLEISTKISAYLKNHQVGTEFVPEETPEVPLENDDDTSDDDDVEDVDDNTSEEASENVEPDVEEFIIDDDDEEPSDEDESEEANESGSDIPEEFIL